MVVTRLSGALHGGWLILSGAFYFSALVAGVSELVSLEDRDSMYSEAEDASGT